ncbi:hypothetical protein C7T35_13900 [Variovorax sp. WS11]|uniref:hypothetical protein n=1 Tax=Variovorax sp. WS11 TaxID=1105204 RepID=UPI000D0D08B7|nr:hypothetical protein [Variovorax sp. WS11]NDZ16217.1 hypothetical protein [Variovorax sp. WS11]PSL84002.1 hypothetical protein C7T35_13900 [Variovorax sp. WS11]
MLHPIFSTVLRHPELIAEHASNYAALIRLETAEASRGLMARLIAGVLAVASAMLALGLTGTAVMLGVMQGTFHWVLIAVPGASALIALVAGYVAARPVAFHGFDELRSQVDADVHALRAAGESRAG